MILPVWVWLNPFEATYGSVGSLVQLTSKRKNPTIDKYVFIGYLFLAISS